MLDSLFSWLLPHLAHAHEVYVLDHAEIDQALRAPTPDFMAVIGSSLPLFIISGIVTCLIIAIVWRISIASPLEKASQKILHRVKHWAPRIAQATLGSAILASGYYGAIFGTELPLETVFGAWAPALRITLLVIGTMLLFGIMPRLAAILTIGIFSGLSVEYGAYMLNYGTYLAEAVALTLWGSAYHLFSAPPFHLFHRTLHPPNQKYKFLFLRIGFGLSLIYASLYAKLIHGELALMTVIKYDLTRFFPFDPLFIVLGAMIIEIMIGIFYIIGFEIRFTSIFFITFLILSILFFKESVWPHVILIGTAASMFTHGYDRFTLTARLQKRTDLEPVL